MRYMILILAMMATLAHADPMAAYWASVNASAGGGTYPMPATEPVLHFTMYPLYGTQGAISNFGSATDIAPYYIWSAAHPNNTNTVTETINGKSDIKYLPSTPVNITTNALVATLNQPFSSKPPTMAMWVNLVGYVGAGANVENVQTFDSFDNLYRSLGIAGTNGTLQVFYYDTSRHAITSTSKIPTNMWTHICVVSGTWGTKFYINGSLDSTNALSWFSHSGGNNQYHGVGAWMNAGVRSAYAKIADYRIYTNELTATEVMGLYQNTPSDE